MIVPVSEVLSGTVFKGKSLSGSSDLFIVLLLAIKTPNVIVTFRSVLGQCIMSAAVLLVFNGRMFFYLHIDPIFKTVE